MTPRESAKLNKVVKHDTGWRTGNMGPRFAPIFKRSKSLPSNWEWRSVELSAPHRMFCLFEVSPAFGKWKAWLIDAPEDEEARVVLRLEDQPGKCGLHVHADCDKSEFTGPQSIEMSHRIPDHNCYHRRCPVWTKIAFVTVAAKVFRIGLEPENPGLFDEY